MHKTGQDNKSCRDQRDWSDRTQEISY